MILAGGAVLMAGSLLLGRGGKRKGNLATLRRRMMDKMMEAMPEDAPPKLIVSILPRLLKQNEQVLALLEEQNGLLRKLSKRR
jgi:hypothetical protein